MPIGEIAGFAVGATFRDRAELLHAEVHRQNQAGISYVPQGPAESIVLNEGYEDDVDEGETVTYTGQGGRDPNTGQQIADQDLTRGNAALAVSHSQGSPVRVIRGPKLRSQFAPAAGYRYDGLYFVERYWEDVGRSGFRIWRYRLRRDDGTRAPWQPPAMPPAGPAPRVSGTIQRLVRNTVIGQRVKELHNYRCQVCGTRLETPAGPYAEAAHIQPLGRPHDGPDIEGNLLCLCPNHHVLFDDGAFGVADDFTLIGLAGKLRMVSGHSLQAVFFEYHRRHFARSLP